MLFTAIYFPVFHSYVGRDSVVNIATPVWRSKPSRDEFSAVLRTGSGTYPDFCTIGTGSFPEVKLPGRDVNYPHLSSSEFKESVELCV